MTDIVAVDVGGTFTDICVLERESGELRVAKVPSTGDPMRGVMAAVEQAGIDLSQVALFSHGRPSRPTRCSRAASRRPRWSPRRASVRQ